MANKEKVLNNSLVQQALEKLSTINKLSDTPKQVIRDLIQNAKYLGRTKIAEDDVYYIVRNSLELSTEIIIYHLSVKRLIDGKTAPQSKSSIEKIKRICIEVANALHMMVLEGTELCKLKTLLPKRMMTDEQKKTVQELLCTDIDIQSLIDVLIDMKGGNRNKVAD